MLRFIVSALLEKIRAVRSAIRKNSRFNIFLVLAWVNLLGVVTMALYFSSVLPEYSALRSLPVILSAIALFFPAAYVLYQRRERPITVAIHAVKNGLHVDPETMAEAKRRLGRRPRYIALLVLILWVAGGVYNASLNFLLGNLGMTAALHQAWAIAVVTNPIVSLLSYFVTELMSRNDMRVLEIDIDHKTIVLGVRGKILFTTIFLSVLTIVLFTAVAMGRLARYSGPEMILPDGFVMQVLVLAGMALAYSVIAAILLTHTITDPLRELMGGMTGVAGGKLEENVHITSTDEVAVLTKNFNEMTRGLRERERLKQVFGRYVSPQFRDEILAGRIELGGEELEATILFADIRQFTTLSEERSPAAILTLLNQYFTEMVRAITSHGGVVDKFIGDALMAVFGVPARYDDHARRALLAAREMGERLKAHNELQRAKGEPELAIGVGINTGRVIAGNIGAEDRREYTTIGDTVNTASRLEGLTGKFEEQTLFAESTYRAAGLGRFVGEADIRGRAGKVKLYGLEG